MACLWRVGVGANIATEIRRLGGGRSCRYKNLSVDMI